MSAIIELVVAAGQDDTGCQAFEIPLPGAGERLVEVIHVEHLAAVRRGIRPEVGEMPVAADLREEACSRSVSKVGGHDLGRPAIEGER